MDWQRILLIGSIVIVSILLIDEWGNFQEANQPVATTQQTATLATTKTVANSVIPSAVEQISADSDLPPVHNDAEEEETTNDFVTSSTSQLVSITSDKLTLLIDTYGGDIVKVSLNDHLDEIDNPDEPFVLLNRTEQTTYIAQSGLVGANGTDTAAGRPIFSSVQNTYELSDGQDTVSADLQFKQGDVLITKRFTLTRGDNLVSIEYIINNRSQDNWQAKLYGQIKRDSHNPIETSGMGMKPFLGAAITTDDVNYEKFTFDDLADDDLTTIGGFKTSKDGGWVAMVQHYFLSAWVPNAEDTNNYSLRKGKGDIYLLSFTGPATNVAANTQTTLSSNFYAGPKDIDRLEEISQYLDLTVDYGWLWWIAKPLFHFMQFIYSILGSWGWSIIVLTICIKAAFFKLSATSYRSMANMRKVQPKMQAMKERYGDNKQKMSEETMKLYKTEKINPLGGCLPMLVQMPVFISLYWVLMESVQLRHTPFMGWIHDLSVMDPYYILPVIMGITMWVQQKLNPTPPDPTQAKVMQMMPYFFTFMFMWVPAGLVLYWVVNNMLSILQQYIITKQIEAEG
jgi:YidC/Oxa1 family membrane protein insertase